MRRNLTETAPSPTGLCRALMVHAAPSSLRLPTQLGPWLLRDWLVEAQGPVMRSVPQSCRILGAWCQADPALEQVLAGSASVEGKKRQQAERSMSAAIPSPRRLSGPLGAVARLACGNSGSTLSCCWHSLSAAPTVHMAGAGCGHGAALGPGEMPTGQPDPGGRGRWAQMQQDPGLQEGKPFHAPLGKGDQRWWGFPLLMPRVPAFICGPYLHPVWWATHWPSSCYWGLMEAC